MAALQQVSGLQRKGGERGEAAADSGFEEQHQPGIQICPLHRQGCDGPDGKGSEKIDGKGPDGKGLVPAQGQQPHQIPADGAHEAPEADGETVQHCNTTFAAELRVEIRDQRSGIKDISGAGISYLSSVHLYLPALPHILPHPAFPGKGWGKAAAGCCANGSIHI